MLTQIVRPLVRSQVKMLAQTPSAGAKLVSMVAQWLGYLGVQAEVTHLNTEGDRIQVSLHVGKPEQCTENEWRQILENITQDAGDDGADLVLSYGQMSQKQKSQVHHLLGCVLHAANDNLVNEWDAYKGQLVDLGLDASMMPDIRAAIQIPTEMDVLIRDLEPEVAAFAMPKAISIALMDRHINQAEDDALKALLSALG